MEGKYVLIEICGNTTKTDLFFSVDEVENEMKKRYNERVLNAKKIDWRNTWFDNEVSVAKVDDWKNIVEFRVGKIRGG